VASSWFFSLRNYSSVVSYEPWRFETTRYHSNRVRSLSVGSFVICKKAWLKSHKMAHLCNLNRSMTLRISGRSLGTICRRSFSDGNPYGLAFFFLNSMMQHVELWYFRRSGRSDFNLMSKYVVQHFVFVHCSKGRISGERFRLGLEAALRFVLIVS